ncbi:uncharacterized protein BDZ99DRAFT_510783 [Mytilinidion resinicola]|uniref:Dienelactone hydrolase domain-containing protein n=1 Tax=Mytilinidion resinicola TaxID=574789 RepID=A0A6A6YD47_9PEZI|nr:uncharacterized protein BDZ99DRAFT_510783 [Mytilinidion resinicola]KAF2806519.1 hypothetical protein BDZ99DRAFT_510783 [Mytilinidion resinicola]
MSCPDCFKGAIHSHKGSPRGHEEDLHGVRTYITGPPTSASASPSTSQSTIIYLTDAFGLSLINNKLLADAYATRTGLRVLAPALIPGGPAPLALLEPMEAAFDSIAWWDLWGQLTRLGNLFTTIRLLALFYLRANPGRASTYAPILAYARAVKAGLPPGARLGVCGFCWGGYSSTKLCGEAAVAGGGERLVDAQFCAHPSALTAEMVVEAVTRWKVPYAVAVGDRDFVFKGKQVEETEAALRVKAGDGMGERGCWYELRVYAGCQHGFAVRARPGDEVQERGAEEACGQAVEWFRRWL